MGFKMFQPPFGTFKVEPLPPAGGWILPTQDTIPQFSFTEADKVRFGKELGQNINNPLVAAQKAFPDEPEKSLWASRNLLSDPVVTAAKDLILNSVQIDEDLVDKEQFCKAILEDIRGSIGAELKDRIAGYKLLAEVRGFVGKNSEPSGNQFTINELTVKFVGKETAKEEIKTIDATPEVAEFDDPIKLKLVSSR
jgi:hypothetical protein